MRYLLILVAVALMVWSAPLPAQQQTPPPLPGDVKIVPPGPGVSPRLATFSGIWEGVWTGGTVKGGKHIIPTGGGREIVIAIERIEPPNVVAVYAWGSFAGKKEGYRRLRGAISGENIVLTLGQEDQAQVTLKLTGDPRRLDATLAGRANLNATLRKR